MNKFVELWNQHEQRTESSGSDSVVVDGETFILPSKEGEKAEVKKMTHPDRKAGINKGAVRELVLYGPQERVESLYGEVFRTLKRLGAEVGPRTKKFRPTTRNEGGQPGLHDLMRWMNNLEADDPRFKDDIDFLKKMSVTLRGRCHPAILKKIER